LASRIKTEQSRADRLAVGLVRYDQLRDQLERAQLTADQEAQRLQRVIRYCQQYQHDQVADVTDHRIDANVMPRSWRYDALLLGLLLLIGITAASMVCWLVQTLDPAVYDPEDVEKNTNVEVLAVVPDCQTRLVQHEIS
jgi:capsular polysaccharide biosynthesis protein